MGMMVAACESAPPPVAMAPMPSVLQDPDSACRAELARVHASFQPLGSYGEGQCRIGNPVKVTTLPVAMNKPGILGCDTVRTLSHFISDTVQPLARKYFGQDVARIDHMGTYDCRMARTEASSKTAGGSKGGKLSEHAKGQAIDFAGVELADGRVISVRDHWHKSGASGAFLHALAQEACKNFNVVLTPNHDRLHWDHIHMDTGPYTLCGY